MENRIESLQAQDALMRSLIERAVAYGRKRKSSQSGFLHYCYAAPEEAMHQTIPVLDNFLFALALLRSRTVENVLEAKEMLEKLLPFQTETGGFPIYLHDYPHCKERYLPIWIGLIVCRILAEFAHVLGSEMRERLTGALQKLVGNVKELAEQSTPPYAIAVSRAALFLKAGELLKEKGIEQQGAAWMEAIDKIANYPDWLSPKALGMLLNALSLVYPLLEQSPWKTLLSFLGVVWHSHLGTYVGPPYQVFQSKNEPQVTLLDHYMGGYEGLFSKRALRESHLHLEAAMVYLTDDLVPQSHYPDQFGLISVGVPCEFFKGENSAYTFFNGKPTTLPNNLEKGFHHALFFWGDRDNLHTMDIQRARVGAVACRVIPNGVEVLFTLDAELPDEDKERNREIIVAIDRFPESSFTVDGHVSSVFQLGQELIVDERYSLKFELRSGEGKFLGHRMPGNRFSQVAIGENNRYDAYDWLIFLRCIARQGPCKMALIIQKININ